MQPHLVLHTVVMADCLGTLGAGVWFLTHVQVEVGTECSQLGEVHRTVLALIGSLSGMHPHVDL